MIKVKTVLAISILTLTIYLVEVSANGKIRQDTGFNKAHVQEKFNDSLPKRFIIKHKNNRQNPVIKGLRMKQTLSGINTGIRVFEVVDGKNSEKLLQDLKENPSIEYIEPDYPIYLHAASDDALLDEQWSIDAAHINAIEAWDHTNQGLKNVIAIIGGRVDTSHVDLKSSLWINPGEIPNNNIDDDNNGYIDDMHGIDASDIKNQINPYTASAHATHVAGIIAAQVNNGVGIAGVTQTASILNCNLFNNNRNTRLQAFISNALICFDYLYDLKTKFDINIIASNNSWGYVGSPSQALYDAIEAQMQAGIITVVATGNDEFNTDEVSDFPSTYQLPNIISVAASNKSNELAKFSNTGRRTVHIAAPGTNILSTVPGINYQAQTFDVNPATSEYFSSVDSDQSDWQTSGGWTALTLKNQDVVWHDSPASDYANNLNSSLVMPEIVLETPVDGEYYLGFFAKHKLETDYDFVFIEAYDDQAKRWIELGKITGNQSDWIYYYYPLAYLIEKYQTNTFMFRFRLSTDIVGRRNGIYIDNIGVGVADLAIGSNLYASQSGTSFSAPMVTAALSMLHHQNSQRTWQQLKNLVLSSGEPLASLTDTSISERVLKLSGENGVGALTCMDQKVLATVSPTSHALKVVKGEPANISVMSINCENPTKQAPEIMVKNDPESVITMVDNGIGFDQMANDGIFSASVYLADFNTNRLTLNLPDNTELLVKEIAGGYKTARKIDDEWVDLGIEPDILVQINQTKKNDDELFNFPAPFSIELASGEQFNHIYVSINGFIHLTSNFTIDLTEKLQNLQPSNIPLSHIDNLIVPFWDDLIFNQFTLGKMRTAVIGNAPNRQFVIEWKNVERFGLAGLLSDAISFQVIFHEASSDIIFNYKNIKFDASNFYQYESLMGVQVAENIGASYSGIIDNPTSLVWSADALTPTPTPTPLPTWFPTSTPLPTWNPIPILPSIPTITPIPTPEVNSDKNAGSVGWVALIFGFFVALTRYRVARNIKEILCVSECS